MKYFLDNINNSKIFNDVEVKISIINKLKKKIIIAWKEFTIDS